MRRFFIDPNAIEGNVVTLSREESHHAVSVLRLKKGDGLDLFDGRGNQFGGRVVDIKEGSVSVRLEPAAAVSGNFAALPVEVTLAVSVIKPDRMDTLIQKAAELAASAIVPVLSERSVVKLSGERWEGKVKRWRKIALESCKQCGQPRIPEISAPRRFEDVLADSGRYDKILIPTLAVRGDILYKTLSVSGAKRILALIGPEGDFTPEEVKLACSRGAAPVSLGPLVLRSETAALYLLSVLNFYCREVAPEKDAWRQGPPGRLDHGALR
ncbi:MAG: 16S rRNA (uracil(1498)-N(3))-methyltransferase [Candidatus Omnitrophota bacterium]